jgi:Family of unknown function (DUF5361)
MRAYRIQIGRRWREVELRSLAEIPRGIVSGATDDSIVWDAFVWGMIKPAQIAALDHAPMRHVLGLWREWQKDSGIEINRIRQLLALIDKHGEPLEADLINKGLRLRDCPSPEFDWRDLSVFVKFVGPHTHIVAATSPKRAGWDNLSMLIADAVDDLNWLVWAKTKAAADGGDPPALIERPGVKTAQSRPGAKVKPMPISKIREKAGLDITQDPEERRKKINAAFR